MDIGGYSSYVVLKAVSLIEDGWKQFPKLILIEDTASRELKAHMGDIKYTKFWDAFYSIPENEIEGIIDELIQKKMLFRKIVQVGYNRSSILFLTGRGKKILYRLDKKYYSIINENASADNGNPDIIKERFSNSYILYNYKLTQVL